MFQVYHSNSLLVLKDLLVTLIQREPLQDPFCAEQILVQSPGMAQWLKLELAQASGIAASVDFPLPASFLWRCFANVLSDVPERSAFNKEAMTWKLMLILPELLKQESFVQLRHYLEDDSDHFRLYQLSLKIADTFDQYLVYRPDWIADWEKGGNLAAANQPWQPPLWRALVSYTAELEQPHWHRANMFGAFIDGLKHQRNNPQLPQRLFVFGISALPENYIQALQALGRDRDVHLMVMNPCRHFWGDILDQMQIARINRRWFGKNDLDFAAYAEGNPLLASMGKLGRDYLYQLQENCQDEITAFADLERTSLLHSLQQDILDLENPATFPADPSSSETKTAIDKTDHSLVLHSCHSPLREIEVLHDQLLALFEQNPNLRPRDIIVMMPDVAAYAPYIDAVFANVSSERFIPYSISDRSDKQENPVLLSFEALLNIGDSRFSVSDVLALLEVPAIMARLQLNEAGFQVLRNWVDQANIRWGIDAEQRCLFDLPLFEQNSWLAGLRRMLAGYALGEQVQLWQEVAPFPEVEGLEAELLGKLCDFIDLLSAYREAMAQARPLDEWISLFNDLIERTYQPEEQDELALNMIRQTLQGLLEQHRDANFDLPLSAAVIVDYLVNGMNSQRSSQRFMVGAVNFCTLMPMRSIPFKVVCLLGMNDGAYPRSIAPIGFDLMTEYPRRGDRSRRDDDRYLFLEALLSAQDKLYISYVGRSIKDNREKVCSVLVSELLDYVGIGYCLAGDQQLDYNQSQKNLQRHLLLQHPMTPFSPRYFRPAFTQEDGADSRLFSYAQEWLPVVAESTAPSAAFLAQTLPSSEEQSSAQTLELNDLISFLLHPCKHFLNQRLRVYFYNNEVDTQDDEPFAVAGLDAYLLKQRYLDAALRGEDLDALDRFVSAEGVLPIGQTGQLLLQRIRYDCETLAEKMQPLCDGEAERIEIDIDLGDVYLQGWLNACYPTHQLAYRPANIQPKDRLNSWIKHLALCAADQSCNTTIYRGLSGKLHYRAMSAEQAKQYLSQLVTLYQQGQTKAQAFIPAAAQEYLKQQARNPDNTYSQLENLFLGSSMQLGWGSDPYLQRCYPNFDAFYAELIPLVEQIYAPMQAYVEESKEERKDD